MPVDRFIPFANWILIALSGLYAYSMLIHPWLNGGWKYVHAVWFDWQSLNVGILAFLASVIAFNVSRYNATQQRKRELVAARSFLPESLSELSEYLKKCSGILAIAYENAHQHREPPADIEAPLQPNGYKEIFSRCISLADRELAEHLSYILSCLQVNHARICSFICDKNFNPQIIVNTKNVLTYLFRLGELQALINSTFNYARGEENFVAKPLDWESYRTAYATLALHLHNIDELDEFTKRAIEREAKRSV